MGKPHILQFERVGNDNEITFLCIVWTRHPRVKRATRLKTELDGTRLTLK